MVQDRFYSILKGRLRREFHDRPPLFPWETEIKDYPDDLWNFNLQSLHLPIALPESILEHIFTACQTSLHSLNQKGRQLVQSVEALFPEYPNQLNDLAGMMLLGAARDQASGKAWMLGQEAPENYDVATPQQQMALALLAADQILFNLLSLDLSPHQGQATCRWETTIGTLVLQAEQTLEESGSVVHLSVSLPCAGKVEVQVGNHRLSQHRADAGTVSFTIALDAIVLQHQSIAYPLTVYLEESENPLPFLLRWTSETDSY